MVKYTWESSDPTIASVTPIDDGAGCEVDFLDAHEGFLDGGDVTIRVTDTNGQSATHGFGVLRPVTQIYWPSQSVSLSEGQTYDLAIRVIPENANDILDVTSSNPNIASAVMNGRSTLSIIAGSEMGEADITVTARNSGVSLTQTVNVVRENLLKWGPVDDKLMSARVSDSALQLICPNANASLSWDIGALPAGTYCFSHNSYTLEYGLMATIIADDRVIDLYPMQRDVNEPPIVFTLDSDVDNAIFRVTAYYGSSKNTRYGFKLEHGGEQSKYTAPNVTDLTNGVASYANLLTLSSATGTGSRGETLTATVSPDGITFDKTKDWFYVYWPINLSLSAGRYYLVDLTPNSALQVSLGFQDQSIVPSGNAFDWPGPDSSEFSLWIKNDPGGAASLENLKIMLIKTGPSDDIDVIPTEYIRPYAEVKLESQAGPVFDF